MREGSIPEAVILSHENDRHRLALTVPEALPRTVVAGDPCFDRMLASRHLIPAYRAALGAAPDTTVVTVSSTWGAGSVLGQHPNLIDDLLGELPVDEYVVAAIVHPNVWFAHGPLQLRTWFANALRAGLRLIPPISGWQQTVLASDIVIGDHGAVTGYAAAHAIPTVLAAFPREDVAEGSVIDRLGELAPTLRPSRPLPPQIARAITDFDPVAMRVVRTEATSHPGACLDTLRSTFYRLLRLPEPDNRAPEFPYPPADLVAHRDPIRACWISCEPIPDALSHRTARVHRWPADVTARSRRGHRTTDAALVVYDDHPRRDLTGTADVLVVSHIAHDPDESLSRTLRRHPGCSIAMTEIGPHHVRLRFRDGSTAEALLDDTHTGPMPIAFLAALVHLDREAADYTILAGAQRMTFRLKRIRPAAD
ncbi:hypothetical protein [Nocardia lasii]|uniref:Uncharacterized protein n=1 Tax=Nocardia lasii TaxID=1616107 RepID=A0ABW1JNJ5_9NOCA